MAHDSRFTPGVISARPTSYNGVMMRSRLEAAWAEQFDHLGWRWQYEPLALAGPTGQYLPDFLVHIEEGERNLWFEIKGGWWEDPVARGLSDDDDGWADLYELVGTERRQMSTLIMEHDPDGFFFIARATAQGGIGLEMWEPGHKSFMPSGHASICECGKGCNSLVSVAASVCSRHRAPWQEVVLVPSLHAHLHGRHNGVDPLEYRCRLTEKR